MVVLALDLERDPGVVARNRQRTLVAAQLGDGLGVERHAQLLAETTRRLRV